MAPQATDGTTEVTLSAVPSTSDRITRSVRGLLAARRLTGTDLATHLGISTQAIHRRYAGTTPWRIDEIDAIAAWLGTSPDLLLATGDRLTEPTEASA